MPRQPLIVKHSVGPDSVRNLRQKVPLLASLQPLEPIHQEQLELVLAEHLTNIVLHNATPRQIEFQFDSNSRFLWIWDDGCSIQTRLAAVDLSVLPDPLNEFGRGLWLIKQTYPELEYHSNSHGNWLGLPLPKVRPHLLLIDDDAFQLAILEAWLESDYQLSCFNSSRDAIAYLQCNQVDLILCDIFMPHIDGLALRQQVLSMPERTMVPFVFLSGDDSMDLKHRTADLLIDDYIHKPIEKGALQNTVQRVLKRNLQLRRGAEASLDQAITSSLWTKLPHQWQGWQLALGYQVASRGGGDFVFHQPRLDSQLLIIGDVMGHGEQAKFFAYAISGFLQGLCHSLDSSLSPGQILTKVSDAMIASEVLQNTLMTLIVVEIFPTGHLTFACAGHPAPYLIRANGMIEKVNVVGILPSLIRSPCYDELDIQLQSGETCLLYSDGIVEPFTRAGFSEDTAFGQLLTEEPLQLLKTDIRQFLQAQFSPPYLDDLTLVSIQRI